MSIEINIIASVAGAIGSLIASFLFDNVSKRLREAQKRRKEAIEEAYKKSLSKYIENYSQQHHSNKTENLLRTLLDAGSTSSASSPISGTFMTRQEIQGKIDESIVTLNERIENIEKRFPEQDTVDKIASVNEAVLGTKIDNLTLTIQKLEEKLLSRWDVVKIVFQIIAALSALIGIILALATFFLK